MFCTLILACDVAVVSVVLRSLSFHCTGLTECPYSAIQLAKQLHTKVQTPRVKSNLYMQSCETEIQKHTPVNA